MVANVHPPSVHLLFYSTWSDHVSRCLLLLRDKRKPIPRPFWLRAVTFSGVRIAVMSRSSDAIIPWKKGAVLLSAVGSCALVTSFWDGDISSSVTTTLLGIIFGKYMLASTHTPPRVSIHLLFSSPAPFLLSSSHPFSLLLRLPFPLATPETWGRACPILQNNRNCPLSSFCPNAHFQCPRRLSSSPLSILHRNKTSPSTPCLLVNPLRRQICTFFQRTPSDYPIHIHIHVHIHQHYLSLWL